MEPETIELVRETLSVFGVATNEAIDAYVVWFKVSAIFWIWAGLLLIFFVLRQEFPIGWGETPKIITRWAVVIVGALCILFNVPDLLAPKAISIHQLILDVRGSR